MSIKQFPRFPSYISALDEYQQLIREYEKAERAHDVDPSDYSRQKLQGVIRDLKRQNEIVELSRMMLT